ncbi:MAG TPA: hypothetical protein VFS21_01005 [Roseiflexaceae bacterium]|nr:hypothetical protein [Roseiflexaceae bacterium]
MEHLCLADISGPFYNTGKPFRNWSSLPFYQLDLPEPPYVDLAQLGAGVERAVAHLDQLRAQGYTGVVVDNLAHLVCFDAAPAPVYPPGSPFVVRARAYQAAFGRLFAAAERRGMGVFVTADMQWSTPPLRDYVGPLRPDNPRLAAVNRWALDELFRVFPQVAGLVVRTGEAGGAHNQGADYTGHMLYTGVAHLRGLIAALLPVCERRERLLIIRTWSIGIGELGDLIWSPERYRAVFRGFDSPRLLASVKHGPTDFFRLLPPNPTLGLPGPRQIVELQNRREYELFGMVPSSVAGLHAALLRAARDNTRFAGVWAWNATGGWGGGSAALGPGGWNCWTELSSALTAALLCDPACDTDALVEGWCAERFGPAFGAVAARLYRESGELIERGWYICGSIRRQQTADGELPTDALLGSLYLPPLLWVWWMRPTAAPLIWAYLASVVPDPDAPARDSAWAVARLDRHIVRLAAALPPGDPQAAWVLESARFMRAALAVAHELRRLLLPAYAAALAGDRAGWLALASGAGIALAALRQHRAEWGARSDFPALELAEVELYLRRLERAPRRCWRQARTACLVLRQVRARQRRGRWIYAAGLGAALAFGLARGGRLAGASAALASLLLAPPLRRRALRATLPWLRRLNLLPSIFFEAGPALTEWTS